MIEELYKKYYEELINWCHSMTGNLYTAEELVHEAFLRAMLHEDTLSTLKEQQSRSWLYRTVKNLYVDRLRHGKKEIILDEFSQPQIDSEELVRLEWEKLLETLPPEFRRVHRSFVVNADNIQRVVLSQNLVYLRGDVAVPLSRSYKKEVREYDA